MTGQLPEGLALVELGEGAEPFALTSSFTIGRHIENDLVVAGEDVRDFHARCQFDERGLQVIPLDAATIEVNQLHVSEPWRLVPSDELQIGSQRLRLIDTSARPTDALTWALHYKGEELAVHDDLIVGRGPKAGISFNNSHISREHARVFISSGLLWLLDLNSANGTFVNGKRLRGGCRLFHGDELSFDQLAMQVVGHGQDLTPVRPRQPNDLSMPLYPVDDLPEKLSGTLEMAAVRLPDTLTNLQPSAPGCYLIGQTPPLSGRVFNLQFGASTIGRDPDAEIRVEEPSVSARHAEVAYRSDGLSISNLFSTNGTRVNGREIVSTTAADGDVITVGNVSFLVRLVEAEPARRGWPDWWPWAAAAVVLMALFVLLV